MRSIFIFLATCIMSSATLFAQRTFYVATAAQGGNDANAGTSIAAPFATINKAISSATIAGDSIMVRSGTYTHTTTVSISSKAGNALKHFVLSVYKPDMVSANSRPVLDFSSMAASSSNRGINLSNSPYWDIYGIVIKGAGDNGLNVSNSSYATIEFCSFLRNRDTGLQIGGQSRKVTVINCDSYENADLGAGTTSNGGNADGYAAKLDVGDSTLFRGCRAWMNSDDGWDGYLRPSNNITTILEDCWAFRNGYYWLDNSTTSSMNGNGFKLGGSDTKDLANNFVVTKCLAFYNKANGYDQNSNAGSIYLYNNSAYQNLGRDYFFTSGTVTYKAGAELVLINNMSLGSKGVSLPTASTSTRSLTTATNSFSTATTHPEIISFDTTGVTTMRSVDGTLPVLNFMRLNAAAPTPYTYIDKGTILSNNTYRDTKGIPYNGSAPDLGAFELNSGTFPVKMISFTAANNSDGVLITWRTASETDNKGWSVERKENVDQSLWKALGFVSGQGSNNQQTTYVYLDKTATAGSYYYRLKQVDQDGKITNSSIILVKIDGGKLSTQVNVFPNPMGASATVRYHVPTPSNVTLNVYDQSGRLAAVIINEKQVSGTYQKLINGATLSAGQYFIKLFIGDKISSTSFTKN